MSPGLVDAKHPAQVTMIGTLEAVTQIVPVTFQIRCGK